MSNYRRLFAVPHVLSLLSWSLVARFYMPGQMIAVTFLVVEWTGSYTYAGVVAGAFTLGMALVGPLRGRMADRGGSDRLVLVCGAVFATGLVVLALFPASLWWLAVPLALATGLFGSPANQIVRALWPRLTRGPERQAIYAAEATTQELLFVFSPILTAGVVAYWGPRWSLLLLALLALAGSIGFALALRRAGVTGPAPAEPGTAPTAGASGTGSAPGRRRSLVLHPVLGLLFAMCLLMIAGIIGTDLMIVAWANELDAPEYVMVLASVWALGSLVGGMVSGAVKGPPHLVRRCFATTLGLALVLPFLPPITHLPTPLLATPVLFLAGLAVAPTLAAVMGRIGDSAPSDRRAEAFGWLATAMGVGAAIAGPLAGGLIDGFGIAGGAAATVGALLVASVLSLFAVRRRADTVAVSERAVS
ncbi:MFS transporter [Nocardiopsis aegyptia]